MRRATPLTNLTDYRLAELGRLMQDASGINLADDTTVIRAFADMARAKQLVFGLPMEDRAAIGAGVRTLYEDLAERVASIIQRGWR